MEQYQINFIEKCKYQYLLRKREKNRKLRVLKKSPIIVSYCFLYHNCFIRIRKCCYNHSSSTIFFHCIKQKITRKINAAARMCFMKKLIQKKPLVYVLQNTIRVINNFDIFAVKDLYWNLFLIKLQFYSLQFNPKRDYICVFLRILWNY